LDKNILGILIAIFAIGIWVRWLHSAKGTPYRKTIWLMGICWIISIAMYTIRITFNLGTWQLSLIAIIAFIVSVFFLRKAIIKERSYKKDSSHQKEIDKYKNQ